MTVDLKKSVFDVAVVGAGPAGSATARQLAMQGWRVALLERTRFESPRIGESLAPNVQEPLRKLGLWSQFTDLAGMPSWGTVSLWGGAGQVSHSHLVNAYGCGWHVDRQAFDQMLAKESAAAGASLLEGLSIQRSTYQEGLWHLHTSANRIADRQDQGLCARVLIDATGRRAQIARSQGAKRLLFDRLVGVAVRFIGVDTAQAGFLLVETSPEGWWYSSPLPPGMQDSSNSMIVMLMTDADLCSAKRLSDPDLWHAALTSTHATRQRLKMGRSISEPQVFYAHSQRLRHDLGDKVSPWLAVGDAALAVDPISGSGVIRALLTAHAAAETVSEILIQPNKWQELVESYEAERDRECTKYLLERAQYYSVERRFDTPFWQRRRVL
jgi:flavin-dependent dehydrogenase